MKVNKVSTTLLKFENQEKKLQFWCRLETGEVQLCQIWGNTVFLLDWAIDVSFWGNYQQKLLFLGSDF